MTAPAGAVAGARRGPGVLAAPVRWYWARVQRVRPTRDGWWCLFAAVGLGVAAVNTGNNLAYLLCSMLLALVLVSGAMSDQALRGLELEAELPEEVYAGRPALFSARVRNGKRWFSSYSISLEASRPGVARRLLHVPRLLPGEARLATWEATLPMRGRRRLPALRVTTRFPFALFTKTAAVSLEPEVLVFPAVGPVPPERLRELGEAGEATTRRRGRGHDLHNLRPYRAGDDPRLIHWPSSARTQELTVRELEEETAVDTRLVLEGTGAADPLRLERGLSTAASLAVHILRGGAGLEVVGPGVHVPLGRGRGQERRVLEALALYAPGAGAGSPAARPLDAGGRREVRVALG